MTAVDTPAGLTARRLAEVRMRLAHRAVGTELALARSVAPGDALPAGAARAEIYRGEESAARRAIEIVGPIVTRASSWAGLHAALARHGIAYAAKGAGGVIVVDGIAVKASTCRAASRTRLETRLGPFQPGPEPVDARPRAEHPKKTAAASPPRPAPGIDPDVFALARQAEAAASTARSAYDAAYPMLNFAPLLKAAVAGPAPRAAPSARSLAQRAGKPSPRLVPVRRPTHDGSNLAGLLGRYHAAMRADRYRVVAERPRPRGDIDHDADPGRDRDRLVQLTPRPMAEVAAAWAALERAGGTGSAVHLTPISAGHHHVVLSGLRRAQVVDLQASGFTPAMVLHRSDGYHEVVLTTPNHGRPYEQAALAEASEDLRLGLGVARSPYGLRIDDPDHPDTAAPGADGRTRRVYAQVLTATGALCEKLGRRIAHWIGLFARRFGLGPGSRLGRGLGPAATEPDGAQPHGDAPVYWAHRADLLARWQGRWPDPSRVDALIARRLCGTGHGEDAVAALITACAPMVPRIGRHVWSGYGRRAAAHAFRGDPDDSCWALDRSSPEMWRELERVVREREQTARKDRQPEQPMPPPVPDLPEIAPMAPSRQKIRVGTTGKGKGANKRDDDWWD
ncbi:DNA-primase RepB domain-containing protein [Methylobacterium oryzae]|uniref:Relaxase/primase-like fusion protein n=1 Tax=Methylobacterium oryzae CBMB20 TaxID=693986 RepID=A0A089NUA6_9HYPH|nr:DNA-primase RepB domain-containing protein [Methylobacterium oryzae]AIQ89403.1 Relaxase/primase-like fusion protein [Methylobacterium oryzae CBMB20]